MSESYLNYSVFGGVLASQLDFPELDVSTSRGEPTWTLTLGDGPVMETVGGGVIAHEALGGGVTVHREHYEGGWLLRFSDTGVFIVRAPGRTIEWIPGADANRAAARMDVLTRVLPLALEAGGALCLHAAAVAWDGGAVALLGDAGSGKSTLAAALVTEGGKLVTDDVLAVRLSVATAECNPGVQRLRLRPEVAAALDLQAPGSVSLDEDPGGKRVVALPPGMRITQPSIPLSAAYVVGAVEPESAAAGKRVRMAPIEAALLLAGHGRLAALRTPAESAEALDTASRLAERVAVFRYYVPRDVASLRDTARGFVRRHTRPEARAENSRRTLDRDVEGGHAGA